MFITTNQHGVLFTPEDLTDWSRHQMLEGVTPVAWSVPVQFIPFNQVGREYAMWNLLQTRISLGERVYVDNWSDMETLLSKADLYPDEDLDNVYLVCMETLRDRMGCSSDELIHAITKGRFEVPDVFGMHADIGYDDKRFRANQAKLTWQYYSSIVAWMCDCPALGRLPVPQALGYENRVTRHMVIALGAEDQPKPLTAETINADMLLRSLNAHVNLAAKVALDTPQDVTVDIGGDRDFQLRFTNVRYQSIQGLRIDLPTGGFAFMRNVELNRRTGAVMRDNRGIPHRTLLMLIVEKLAHEMAIHGCFGAAYGLDTHAPDAVADWRAFRDANR